ncbi:MAG: YfcC family protein [Dehalococcoidia bacterium]|nr:YfcC family protein [Dehalococcoidia bacterium]
MLIWIAAFFIPPGEFQLDEDGSPIAGTYQRIDDPQTFGERVEDLVTAPVNGLYGIVDPDSGAVGPFNSGPLFGAAGVFLFVLAIGAFMTVSFATGALDTAIGGLAHRLKERGSVLIAVMFVLFALLSTAMGWAEESLGFYALIVPMMLSLGYDRLVGVAVVFVGAAVGTMASTVNPFSIGVASGEAGISIGDGIVLRVVLWLVLVGTALGYTLWYARRVRSDPARSLMPESEAEDTLAAHEPATEGLTALTGRQKAVLVLVAGTFGLLVFSVIPWGALIGYEAVDPVTHETIQQPMWFELGWWFPELTALFIVMAIVIGVVGGLGETGTSRNIGAGVADFVGPALMVVLARGVAVIMNNTRTLDTILNSMESLVSGTSSVVFTILIFIVNVPLAFLIPSSSGHAALAIPILAPLGDFAEVDRSLIVTAWNMGAGWIRMVLPTNGVLIAGLALAGVAYNRYLRFMLPLLALLLVPTWVLLAVAAVV